MEITDRHRTLALVCGLICHGMFAAGVTMMMFQMYFDMYKSFGTLASPNSWLVNALLLIQFPMTHSVLLSASGRRVFSHLAPRAIAASLTGELWYKCNAESEFRVLLLVV